MKFIQNYTGIRRGCVHMDNLFHAGDSKIVDRCHNYLLSR